MRSVNYGENSVEKFEALALETRQNGAMARLNAHPPCIMHLNTTISFCLPASSPMISLAGTRASAHPVGKEKQNEQ
jgi:hypothetical protein